MFNYTLPDIQIKVDGTFEGGGALGTAFVGALMALQRRGIWFERVSGNSAGAITASMIAAGYNANEIDWLSAPSLPQSSRHFRRRPTTIHNELNPIEFTTFIDRVNTVDITNRRRSFLWHAIKGTFIDEILKLPVQTPPIDQYITDAVNGVLGVFSSVPLVQQFRAATNQAIRSAFSEYPQQIPLSVFLLASGPALGLPTIMFLNDQLARQAFANLALDVMLTKSQDLRTLMHLTCKGSLVKGDVFLNTIRRILKAKVFNDPDSTSDVTFKDLKMDLIIVASNITSRESLFFSKQRTPNASVAEAVRQSMSVPFLFQHRLNASQEIMDGGLVENYPWWIFLPLDTDFTRPLHRGRMPVGIRPIPTMLSFPVAAMTSTDVERPKVAFSLDDNKLCPANYNCLPGPWANVPEDTMFWDSLKSSGIFDNIPSFPDETDQLPEAKTIKRALAMYKTASSQLLQQVALDLAKKEYPQFHHAGIPLKDFFWLDFTVNEDIDKFNGICMRGWETAMELVNKNNLVPASNLVNPYHS